MSADKYHEDCDCRSNDGCLSLIFLVAVMTILFWGEPDMVDGIIHWLMK